MPPLDFDELAKTAFDKIKGGLGIPAVYLPKIGGRIPIRGVFDNRAIAIDPDTQQPISSNIITLGIQLGDIPNKPAKGDKVEVKNEFYKLVNTLEDGVIGASVVLVLHRV